MKQLLFSLILIFFINSASGELTNINEVTDLFDRHIENKDQLLHELKTQNDSAIDNIKSGAGVNSIEGINEAESKASELKSIKETDLENKGREKRASKEYQFYDENELEPNYNKSGNKLHKLDAEDIVNATEESMRKLGKNFLDKLKAVGVDCHTVKGPVHKEPTYYIQIKRENQNNTDYDQFFCEELRNKYDCRDQLDLTCKRFGKGYTDWEARTIRFNGHVLHNEKENWGWAVHWKTKRWGWHIHSHHPKKSGLGGDRSESPWRNNPAAIIADARAYIASQLGVSIEQIGEDITFPPSGRGVGSINSVGHRWRVVWDEYEFAYMYRDVFDTCEEWQEDWTERCAIK
jgi:hypothetical protein